MSMRARTWGEFAAALVGSCAVVGAGGCGEDSDSSRAASSPPSQAVIQAALKCPVCGRRVTPVGPLTVQHGGVAYTLCSPQHKRQFLKDPGKYAIKPERAPTGQD